MCNKDTQRCPDHRDDRPHRRLIVRCKIKCLVEILAPSRLTVIGHIVIFISPAVIAGWGYRLLKSDYGTTHLRCAVAGPSVATLQSASINSQTDMAGGGAADGDWNVFLCCARYIVSPVSSHVAKCNLTAEKACSLKVGKCINDERLIEGVAVIVIIYKLVLHTYRMMYAYIFHLWYSGPRPSSKLLEDDWHCKCLFLPHSFLKFSHSLTPFYFPSLLLHLAPFVAVFLSPFFNSNSRQVLCGK